MAAHLGVACDVFGVGLFVLSFFPRDVLFEIWDWIESIPKDISYLLFHCTQTVIITLPSFWYKHDWNTVEKDVNSQISHQSISLTLKVCSQVIMGEEDTWNIRVVLIYRKAKYSADARFTKRLKPKLFVLSTIQFVWYIQISQVEDVYWKGAWYKLIVVKSFEVIHVCPVDYINN